MAGAFAGSASQPPRGLIVGDGIWSIFDANLAFFKAPHSRSRQPPSESAQLHILGKPLPRR